MTNEQKLIANVKDINQTLDQDIKDIRDAAFETTPLKCNYILRKFSKPSLSELHAINTEDGVRYTSTSAFRCMKYKNPGNAMTEFGIYPSRYPIEGKNIACISMEDILTIDANIDKVPEYNEFAVKAFIKWVDKVVHPTMTALAENDKHERLSNMDKQSRAKQKRKPRATSTKYEVTGEVVAKAETTIPSTDDCDFNEEFVLPQPVTMIEDAEPTEIALSKPSEPRPSIFRYSNKDVRVVMVDGNPWWVLKDVCDVLELTSPHKVAERLEDDEKGRNLIPTLGGSQEFTVINESGLYNVILRSDKPEAKKFRKWVTQEVLPSIRQHGMYMTKQKIHEVLTSPDTLITLANQIKALNAKTENLMAENMAMKPYADIAVAFEGASNNFSIMQVSKILMQNGVNLGQNKLFRTLRDIGWLGKRKNLTYNEPSSQAIANGLMVSHRYMFTKNGQQIHAQVPYLTPKGMMRILRTYLPHKTNDELMLVINSMAPAV